MNEFETNWSKDELKAYILMYCSQADFVVSKQETDYIKSKIKIDHFEKIQFEVTKSSDYESIQKMLYSMEKHGYSKDEKETLFNEIKELFLSDGSYEILEKNLFNGLSRILK